MKISKYKKKETVKTIQHDLDKGDLEHHELCMEERRQESSIESLQGKRGGGRREEGLVPFYAHQSRHPSRVTESRYIN
jgi:hypothetical protein